MGCSLGVATGVTTKGSYYLGCPLQVAIGVSLEAIIESFPTTERIHEIPIKVKTRKT